MSGILGKILPNGLIGGKKTRYPGIFLTKGCQLSVSEASSVLYVLDRVNSGAID